MTHLSAATLDPCPYLAPLGLSFHPTHSIIICMLCHSIILQDKLEEHVMQSVHRHYIEQKLSIATKTTTGKQVVGTMAKHIISSHAVLSQPPQLTLPLRDGIPGLSLVHGLACPNCDYVTNSHSPGMAAQTDCFRHHSKTCKQRPNGPSPNPIMGYAYYPLKAKCASSDSAHGSICWRLKDGWTPPSGTGAAATHNEDPVAAMPMMDYTKMVPLGHAYVSALGWGDYVTSLEEETSLSAYDIIALVQSPSLATKKEAEKRLQNSGGTTTYDLGAVNNEGAFICIQQFTYNLFYLANNMTHTKHDLLTQSVTRG